MTQFTFNRKRVLIIPDVHQDIDWVSRILEQETDWDLLIFLGDYFDNFKKPPAVAGVKKTAEYIQGLKQNYGEKVIFLLGNHDLHYLEARPWCDRGHYPSKGMRYRCSGFTHSKAVKITRALGMGFWNNCKSFVFVNSYLISHAGVAGCFFRDDCPPDEALESLQTQCEIAREKLWDKLFGIFDAGHARGGNQEVGGITWLDWNFEFSDDEIPFPQIVGHTPCTNEGQEARHKGRSWCIDGGQTCYGILERDKLSIAYA